MKATTPPNPDVHPETHMMRYAYDPALASHSVKPPLYLTSTFSFEDAAHAKAYGEVINGLREKEEGEDFSNTYIYSRDTNPNIEIFEQRLRIWDGAEACAAFDSGMGAISTLMWAFLNPGDVVLHSEPSYGCTDFLLKSILTRFGIRPVGFKLSEGNAGLEAALKQPGVADKVKLIYIETPSNPSIAIGDIAYCAQVARRLSVGERRVMVAVDNTFLGPIYQKPIALGADIVLYSATKYIGGHSDLLAGAASGKQEDINQMKLYRAMLGPIPAPHTCWLLTRSLETMQLRMEKSAANAQKVAAFLATHPKVEKLHYLGNLKPGDAAYETYKKQCLGPGGMMAIEVINGEAGAFRFLNALNVFHQAVSLGGNESLAVHPKTTTHAEVDPEDRIEGGITDSLVRMSIGIENADDLIADLKQALDKV